MDPYLERVDVGEVYHSKPCWVGRSLGHRRSRKAQQRRSAASLQWLSRRLLRMWGQPMFPSASLEPRNIYHLSPMDLARRECAIAKESGH
jgi:hypothetical protein